MKKSPQNFVLSLALVILLFLSSACQTDNEDSVPDEPSPTPTQQATATSEQSDSESEVAEVEVEETTVTLEATATTPPEATEATELVDSEPATATAEATEAPQATKTAEATVDPNIRPTMTPLVRRDWRAASGDFILQYENGIKIFDYYIILTIEWWEIFEIQQESETHVSFWYTGNPSQKEEVFSITAYRSDEWEERKSNGDKANAILGVRNAIFVYEMVEGNPFSGEHAEKFDELKGSVPGIIADTFEIETRKSN